MAPVKGTFVQTVANANIASTSQCCAKCRCLGLTSVAESQGKDIPYLQMVPL